MPFMIIFILYNAFLLCICENWCQKVETFIQVETKAECRRLLIETLKQYPIEVNLRGMIAQFYPDTKICDIRHVGGVYSKLPPMTGITCTASSSFGSLPCRNAYDGENRPWASASQGIGAWLQINLPESVKIYDIRLTTRNAACDRPKTVEITLDGTYTRNHTFNQYSGNIIATESVVFNPPQFAQVMKIEVVDMYGSSCNVGLGEVTVC